MRKHFGLTVAKITPTFRKARLIIFNLRNQKRRKNEAYPPFTEHNEGMRADLGPRRPCNLGSCYCSCYRRSRDRSPVTQGISGPAARVVKRRKRCHTERTSVLRTVQ